ncbi:ABC-type transport auxiliary lipoprotein family protein [Candidatus Latescibacterota bacterium]
MKKNGLKLALLFGIALIASCSFGKIPTRNYYIISYNPIPKAPVNSNRPYPYSIQVGRFDVQRIFNRQNILYRYSPNQIQYYELQQWAVRPDYMVEDMVFKHLEASTLTNRVGVEFFDSAADFRIEGSVEALEKLDAGDLFFAHLAMSFKMLRISDGSQVWDYSFDQRKQVFQEDMVYTIRGLSSILQAQLDFAVNQIDSLFYSMQPGMENEFLIREDISEQKPVKSSDGVDESDFEIIREKNSPQEDR